MKGIRLIRNSNVEPWVGDGGTQFLVEDDVAIEAVQCTGLLEYIPGDEHNVASVPVVKREDGVSFPDPEEKPREMTLEERYAEILNPDGSPKADISVEEGVVSINPAEPSKEVKRPYTNRPKQEWAAYAVTQGHDPDEAMGLTKNELISLYGERL